MEQGFDFINGEYLLIDKPANWTSFDVVNKIRFLLKHNAGIKKIKVGHAGTLDPLATGLLIICTGKMTKKINELQLLDKEYTGTITIGATTPSFDLETPIDHRFDYSQLTAEDLESARQKLTGDLQQIPPIYSAVKIDGKRAYMYARDQESVKIQPKDVSIHDFEFTKIELPEVDFRISCSKGTYIRSIARDFGELLNNGAHLSLLRRTAVGEFRVEDALTIDQFELVLKSLYNGTRE